MIKAILMDFNGVVIDDEAIQMNVYADVLKGEGIELTEEMYYSCLGKNDVSFVQAVAEMAGVELPDEKVDEIVDAKTLSWKTSVDETIPLFDGISDFIKRMSQSFELGLVSMARRQEIDHILVVTGLDEYFSVVLSAEDVSTTKPDPECYREGFRRIDAVHSAKCGHPLARRACVVIEDAPQGIQAAKGARLKALGVSNTVSAERLREAGADAVTTALPDWNSESFKRVFA